MGAGVQGRGTDEADGGGSVKKRRGMKRRDKGVGFHAKYSMLHYAMFWNTIYEAQRQPFYTGSKRSRKMYRMTGKKAYLKLLKEESE